MERLIVPIDEHVLGFASMADGRPLDTNMIMAHLFAYERTSLTPSDIADLRNELCLKCGKYKRAHEGGCDGCRFRKEK